MMDYPMENPWKFTEHIGIKAGFFRYIFSIFKYMNNPQDTYLA